MTNPATVSRLVKAAREKANMSQVELAARAGLSVSTVSLAERGGFLTERVAGLLAKALGVKPTDIRP